MNSREAFVGNYPVTIDIEVRWGDMDAFGHVNNAMYFRYFESARIAYMNNMSASGVFDASHMLPVLAETACRFKSSLRYPDRITVGCTITEMHDYGFAQEYEVFSHEQDAVVCSGVARIVLLDKNSQQKLLIAPELHDHIQALETLPE